MNNQRQQSLVNAFAIKKLLNSLRNNYNANNRKKKASKIAKSKWWKDTKVTDWGMLIATVALTVGTFKLYHEAVNQSSISKQAADAAKEAADAANKSVLEYKRTNDFAEKSVDEQVQSLKNSQHQFYLENRPYVYMDSIKFEHFRTQSETINGIAYINNFGKLPALLESYEDTVNILNTAAGPNYYKHVIAKTLNKILPPSEPFEIPIRMVPLGGSDGYEEMYTGKFLVIVYGKVKYSDVIFHRVYEYDFSFRVFIDRTIQPYGDHNRTIEIDGKSEKIRR